MGNRLEPARLEQLLPAAPSDRAQPVVDASHGPIQGDQREPETRLLERRAEGFEPIVAQTGAGIRRGTPSPARGFQHMGQNASQGSSVLGRPGF